VNETAEMQVVGQTSNAEEALPRIEEQSPDVVVVEISLGGVDGLTLTRRVRSVAPQTRILVFSVYDASMYAERAIEAGASGYLMKTKPTQEVVQAIHGVAEGEICLGREVLFDVLDSVLRPDENGDSGVEVLSLRELTVFQMLGDGNSVAEIAESLNRSRKTIERHRRRAKEKLGCQTIDELLQYAALWASDRVGQCA
jgi:DNA-binding NarL/FixJ family response regulator